MLSLSSRTKEAIKTGFAMAIAYAIALQMDWDRPYWAAFAVAFISLPTAGQSLHKGILRMLGTLVAGVAALTLIALFPQERWWFMIFLSVYIGFCTYLMTGKKNQYFYQVMAFVAAIICFDGGANSLNAFETAMVRIQQTYNFAHFANSTAMIVLGLSLLLVTSYIPFRPHPEKAFLRLVRRFFRHAEFLISRMALDRKPQIGWKDRRKMMFYQKDILELPQKLAAWGKQIDQRLFPGNTPEQIQTLVNSLHALGLRLKDLLSARENPQSTLLARELIEDVRAWRIAIETLFQRWSDNPVTEPDADLQEQLALKLNVMEARIDQTLTLAEQEALRPEDYGNFYQLIGSYRGLSESAVAHAQLAKGLNWAHWKEERF